MTADGGRGWENADRKVLIGKKKCIYIYIYIYIYIICCERGKTERLYFYPYKPVSWFLTHQGMSHLINKTTFLYIYQIFVEKLLTLKRSGYLSEAVYNKIRPRHKQPHRIYGLPKIHKADVLLRPIVSCVNTFAYDLSAYLANILSPLTGKPEYIVTNSAHFVSTVSNETILDNEIMVSFDVSNRCLLTFLSTPLYKPHCRNSRTTQALQTAQH